MQLIVMVDNSALTDALATDREDPGIVRVARKNNSSVWRVAGDAVGLNRAFGDWTTSTGAVVVMEPKGTSIRLVAF